MQQRINILHFILSSALLLMVPLTPSSASNQIKKLGSFGDWEVVSFYDKDRKSCAVNNSSQLNPVTGQSENIKTILFITNWPLRKEYLAISIRSFAILEQGKTAWLIFPDNTRIPFLQAELDAKPNPAHRASIIRTLQKHQQVEIVTYSKDGQEIKRNFQLQSLDAALATLNRFCPLP